MKQKVLVWGMLAMAALVVGGQVAAHACGKGHKKEGPTQPAPTPETPSDSY